MKMDWIKSIQYIKEAKRNNRLVIFVGSGVSANSGLPTWGGLIDKIAKQIGYQHCEICRQRKEGCEKHCREQYDFNQEEYLKIPEYYYQNCGDDKSEYYDFIQRELDADAESNIINDMIIKLMPHHIITTNYDTLLENSKDINAGLYTVIKKDSDLLAVGSDHYIIKMHGDFDHPEYMVLKESDYINYEQTHVLITTYIKSLLIDHTFLFLGYSLSDSNLKLIIGWINYFSEKLQIENRPYNFLVQYEGTSQFEEKSLELKNIHVVTTKKIQNDIELHEKTALTNPIGKSLYLYLLCIYDEKTLMELIPLEEMLYDCCKQLSNYQYIANDDFLEMMRKFCNHVNIEHHTLRIYDEKFYNELIKVLTSQSEKAVFISNIFDRVEIKDIEYCSLYSKYFQRIYNYKNVNSKCYQLYLDNEYHALFKVLKNSPVEEQLFYSILLNPNAGDLTSLFSQIQLEKEDKIKLLIVKMQEYFYKVYRFENRSISDIQRIFIQIPKDSVFSIHTLKEIVSFNNKLNEMKKLNEKLEKNYCRVRGVIPIIVHDDFAEIQTMAYDLYFFCMKNHIPAHGMNNFIDFFAQYIRAVLCTYHYRNVYFSQHVLNEVDLDIFTKYSFPFKIEDWITQYHVETIQMAPDIDVVKIFQNFCQSIRDYQHVNSYKSIHSFIILWNHLEIEDEAFDCLFEAYLSVLIHISKALPLSKHLINDSLTYFIRHFYHRFSRIQSETLCDLLFADFMIKDNDRHAMVLKEVDPLVCYSISKTKKTKLSNAIVKDKEMLIQGIQCFYPCFDNELLEELCYQNLYEMEPLFVIDMILRKRICYRSVVQNFLIDSIQKMKEKMNLPVVIQHMIENYVLLYLDDFPLDLHAFSEYIEYSELLEFLLDPDTFDYSCVDLLDESWCKLFYHKNSEEYLIKHKEQMVTDQLIKELRYAEFHLQQYHVIFQKLFTVEEFQSLINKRK